MAGDMTADAWATMPQTEPRDAGEWISRRGVSATTHQLQQAGYDAARETAAARIVRISQHRARGVYVPAGWLKP